MLSIDLNILNVIMRNINTNRQNLTQPIETINHSFNYQITKQLIQEVFEKTKSFLLHKEVFILLYFICLGGEGKSFIKSESPICKIYSFWLWGMPSKGFRLPFYLFLHQDSKPDSFFLQIHEFKTISLRNQSKLLLKSNSFDCKSYNSSKVPFQKERNEQKSSFTLCQIIYVSSRKLLKTIFANSFPFKRMLQLGRKIQQTIEASFEQVQVLGEGNISDLAQSQRYVRDIKMIFGRPCLTDEGPCKPLNVLHIHQVLALISPLYFSQILIQIGHLGGVQQILINPEGMFGREVCGYWLALLSHHMQLGRGGSPFEDGVSALPRLLIEFLHAVVHGPYFQ